MFAGINIYLFHDGDQIWHSFVSDAKKPYNSRSSEQSDALFDATRA